MHAHSIASGSFGTIKPSILPPAATFMSVRETSLDGDSTSSRGESIDLDSAQSAGETSASSQSGQSTFGSATGSRKRKAATMATEALSSIDDISESKGTGNKASRMSGTSTSTEPPSPLTGKNEARKVLPRAPPLDFASIRTSAPAHLPPRTKARLFGLEHCPVYYPSIEEFAQPMEYIERITKESMDRQYGICKIVPPEGWQPPFALDTETFRFDTRLQRLNSMEASARANLNFLEQLYIFHRQHKNCKVTIPVIGVKPINLWQLRKEVGILGGYDVVTESRQWPQIGKAMSYDINSEPSIPVQLKVAYAKIIQPFEEYRLKFTANGTPLSSTPSSTPGGMTATPVNGVTMDKGKGPELSPPIVTLAQTQAASNKLNAALNASPAPNSTGRTTGSLLDGAVMTAAAPEELPPGEVCEICQSGEDESSILLCDDCDRGYHLTCLDPPLEAVPKGHWICDTCIIGTGADYGFEEGNEHTFGSFHKRASAFRRKWLALHPPPIVSDTISSIGGNGEDWVKELDIEDHLEREFWRLVESPHETVEVEYGADLHTTRWGSAIPTIESHPAEPYARDGWNLNNLPILHGSLLRYVKSDISGMTVPWGYVGMMFSTFAWHKEDHYTYSVNYQHLGGTKTWYGVPGDDDEALEAAIKAAAPELFQQQPDLMFQLVTLMSPGRLQKAGVRVSVCDQRANEFVITFPKAYHAGFNHDFNYNEAVNFCIPDWLSYDLECVKKYREMNKPPVFSHDELLVTISSYEKSEKASRWLLPLFQEMVERELSYRQQAKATIPNLQILQEDSTSYPDEYYQCKADKSFCYLSQITLHGLDYVVCTDHCDTLPAGQKVMKTRFSDDQLRAMLAKVRRRANLGHRAPPLRTDQEATKTSVKIQLSISPPAKRQRFEHSERFVASSPRGPSIYG